MNNENGMKMTMEIIFAVDVCKKPLWIDEQEITKRNEDHKNYKMLLIVVEK